MKRIMSIIGTAGCFLLMFFLGAVAISYAEYGKFNIYTDKTARGNHYYPSGWMGDFGDLKLDVGCKEKPHSGDTCIRLTYTAKKNQGAGWSGVYWQSPPNNWGDEPGGYDLRGATQLVFWARGEKGGETITEVKVGGICGEYADSDSAVTGPILLTSEWKEYTVDLKGKDMSYISGGFAIIVTSAENPEGISAYLDDIYYR